MKPRKIILLILMLAVHGWALAQGGVVSGLVTDSLSNPIEGVHILLEPSQKVVLTDKNGEFNIELSKNKYAMVFSHVQYRTEIREVNFKKYPSIHFDLKLRLKTQVLDDVEVREDQPKEIDISGMEKIDGKSLENLPSGTGEFNKILSTLPGVVSNNELSSTYSVRGGNFDENLVYVNGIEVYRPFLVRAGRQEGLSFINPDMVNSIEFSAGGWQAKYGDKLSSVLAIEYKRPEKEAATIDLGLLGGRILYEGAKESKDISYILAARHKNTRYLLGNLETKGQYLPKFTDFQGYLNKGFNNRRTNLGILIATAHNRYLTIPEIRETDFGTIQQTFRLTVDFNGREFLKYDTYQAGFNLSHRFSDRYKAYLIGSVVSTNERENFEIEGIYRLCDVGNNPSANTFDECVITRGRGTNYASGRNDLEATIANLQVNNEFYFNNDVLEYGVRWDIERIDDSLKEFVFLDSADFSSVTETRRNEIDLNSQRLSGYVQYTSQSADSVHTLSLGFRLNYWNVNSQLLFSPRLNYILRPLGTPNTNYRFAIGVYQQPPFYRELRDRDGNVNLNVKAQRSIHFIGALDHYFIAWKRPFKFTAELYHKQMDNINPYDVDNVRLRYFADNSATAFAQGIDLRVNGEFIEGTQSWFSLGILNTKEDVANDNRGNIRRPTDQRVNLGIFFEDHFTNDPTTRVNLNLLFGSGLPFGPPRRDDLRNSFPGDEYYRVDIGFSKIINFTNPGRYVPNSLWIGLEILNLLGADNTISYTWIRDVINNQFAIPNGLSARFLNVRVRAKF